MSQTAFAELFNLKRAAIGAYEEERAEPKVEVFVTIARHFGVPVEDLICKNLQKEEYAPSSRNGGIRLIKKGNIAEFAAAELSNTDLEGADYLQIPLIESVQGLIAFEHHDTILIVRPISGGLGSQPVSPHKTLLLLADGIMMASATSAHQYIRQYEILYIIKRFENQDYTESMLSEIAKKLEKM